MPESHERKIKRILSREWGALCNSWMDYLPPISHPGQAPNTPLTELEDLDVHLKAINDSQVEEVTEDIPGLRSGLLHEAIYLLHKGAHVLSASLVHVNSGMCTWSISNAYQSAFFSMRSVMAFLGVGVIQTNRHFLLDVWGTSHNRKLRNKGPVIVLANTKRNEQRNLWAYFQRTVQQTVDRNEIWYADNVSQLLNLDYTDFGRQRNHLHYYTSWWPLNDLHECITNPTFGSWRLLREIDSNADADFPLQLAISLVGMSRDLLADLSNDSLLFRRELGLVDTWLAQPNSQLYTQSQERLAAIEKT